MTLENDLDLIITDQKDETAPGPPGALSHPPAGECGGQEEEEVQTHRGCSYSDRTSSRYSRGEAGVVTVVDTFLAFSAFTTLEIKLKILEIVISKNAG